MARLLKYGKGTIVKEHRLEREVVTSKGCVKVVVKAGSDGKYKITRKLLNLLFNKDWLVVLVVGSLFFLHKKRW